MPIYNLKLTGYRPVANSTFVYEFEKPAGFKFIPGQYGGYTLINPSVTDNKGATRRFSLLSTPLDNHIAFVTRMQTSAFKQSLQSLHVGDIVKFAGPTGNFILHPETEVPAVLIAGGVGIAPFYSMLRDIQQTQSPRTVYLFYGNRSIEDAPFFKEIAELSKQIANFHFIPVLENADANWSGEKGYITDTLLRKTVADFMVPIYYICGSPAMVTALQETVLEMGVPDSQVKVEDFPGY